MAMAEQSLPIALDAMGGDNAPREVVRGAALAVRELGVRVALVGYRADIERELATLPPEDGAALPSLSIVEATEVVAMGEHPAQAVRSKRDASINVACREAAAGRARAVVSAGNSGAVLAAALLGIKRVPGVARPAIGALIPGPGEHQTFVLDVGANTDCKPEWLMQFGIMGNVYATQMMRVANPRVALLSNGEERGKGNELVQATEPLLTGLQSTLSATLRARTSSAPRQTSWSATGSPATSLSRLLKELPSSCLHRSALKHAPRCRARSGERFSSRSCVLCATASTIAGPAAPFSWVSRGRWSSPTGAAMRWPS